MAFVEISDVGNYGFSRGAPYHELPPGLWTTIKNVRVKSMGVEKFSGHEQVFGNVDSGANPIWAMQTIDNSGNIYWLYCDLDKIWVTDGTQHKEITKAATTYNGTLTFNWNGGNLNGVPVMNNSVDVPQYWPSWDFSTPATCLDIPDFANHYDKCTVLRPFGNFLVALDVVESGTRYPYKLAWSDVADPGSLPTDWDPASSTNKAGNAVRGGAGGILKDAAPLGNALIIYKESAIHLMRFVGGAAVFDFKELSTEAGVLSRRCIAAFKKRHFVLGQGDIYIHNTGDPESILDQNERSRRLRNWFFNQIDSSNYDRSFVVPSYLNNEIWACIPEAGADFPTLALVWNYKENTFGIRELTDTVSTGSVPTRGIPHIAFGVVVEDGPLSWNSTTEIWNGFNRFWDVSAFNPSVLKLLLLNHGHVADADDGMLFVGDTGSQFNGNNYEAYVERRGLAIIGQRSDGGYNVDTQVNKFIRAVYPRVEVVSGTGLLDVYVGSQQYIDGPITWQQEQFDPTTDEKCNFTVNGRFISVKFGTQSSSSLMWRLKGYALDMSLGGRW